MSGDSERSQKIDYKPLKKLMILLKTKKLHRVKNDKKSILQNLVKNVEIIFF